MLPQIKRVAKHKVGQRAHFDADILFNVLLNQVREKENLETMANTLAVQLDAGVQVCYRFVVGLSSVAESTHAKGRGALVQLGGQNLRHK